MTTSDIAQITGGKLFGPGDIAVTSLLTDSRSATSDAGGVFFAIPGSNHDGHNFVRDLAARGIMSFVVTKVPGFREEFPGCAFIEVSDTIDALQSVAGARRRDFRGEVIAITGSAGKTIVKEWLSYILGRVKRVVRSPRSYNSQTGVPLSVWRLTSDYDCAVIEAGISLPGEMVKLQRIIMPATGIITNIGEAHQENFADIRHKVEEKLGLFRDAETIIFPSDNKVLTEVMSETSWIEKKVLAGWSFADRSCGYYVEVIRQSAAASEIVITHKNGSLVYEIPFGDRASVENSVTVAVACLAGGIPDTVIREGMASLAPVAMRMSVKNGINGCLLIEDYYNSDPGSLAMAIDFLKNQQGKSHTLILSDFLQTGRDNRELAVEVAGLVRRGMISRFIGIGPGLAVNSDCFDSGSSFFHSTAEFLSGFTKLKFRDEIVLLKGARIFEFERIASLLEMRSHTTMLEINLDSISYNLSRIRSALKPGVRIMGMVKAAAYGSGIAEIGSLLEFNRTDYLGVAYADEGVELREAGISIPIMVMSPEEASYDIIIRYNLEPELYSFRVLNGFIAEASKHGVSSYPVHVKIDTGMHRLGFLPDEAEELAMLISGSGTIRVASLFSHLAASESEVSDSLTIRQATIFEEVCDRISTAIGYHPMRHLLNSSGLLRFPQYQYDMVRPGIALYGLADAGGLDLKQTSRYVSRISQIKLVRAGEPVGYGYAGVAANDRFIATIPVGYADGLRRQMGNGRGAVWIDGRAVPLVGNICMDMCMADITGTSAREGDHVEIFGDNISVREVAAVCNTIPYEIITSIPPRVRRIFYHD
ncbi:MAG: bifunctional UDP-N-acetylmuramoyl-tripeptide:D-alanyl-D-alanine ligase/alanine racemase [Bacteroidales bacterium]|nr:bifunctional UDP-N-acetylmuramoyl-tripeptide:D-alanyl-D-alanine ligase/alanine racemase [Bacteroidales bacterium]